jgi:hypothetical protein
MVGARYVGDVAGDVESGPAEAHGRVGNGLAKRAIGNKVSRI